MKRSPTELERRGASAGLLAIVALVLVVGGVGLLWAGYRGVETLRGSSSRGDGAAYVGTWTGDGETLTFGANGHVDLVRSGPQANEVHGPSRVDGTSLVVDGKRLRIDAPPHEAGAKTTMTLDGVVLEKK